MAFVSTRALGVPRLGVTKIGDVAETGLPVPVAAVKDGAAVEPVKFPKCVFAAAVESEKVWAGVVLAVATDVVNRGERLPEENVVTPPLQAPHVRVPLPLFERHPAAFVGTVLPRILATVVARLPAEFVMSPVWAGSSEAGKPVAFVRTSALGVPRAGVTSTGELAATGLPVPVTDVNEAAPVEPVKFPKAVFAPALAVPTV